MVKNFAKLVALVFNPIVLLSLLPFLVIYKVYGDIAVSIYWEILSLIFVGAFSLFVLIGVKLGFFSNIDVSNRTQRPILFTSALFIIAIYVVALY